MTALQGVAKCGHLELMRLLLDAHADVNSEPSMNRATALQAAVQANNEAISTKLILAGADVNAFRNYQDEEETTLMVAVVEGHPNMARQLLSFGADVNKRGTNKPSALELVVDGAAAEADYELVDILLDAQADPNACSGADGQDSPLGAAASWGDVAIAQRLLMAKADVDLGNPLAAAAAHGHVDMVRLLLSKQANVNSMKGNTYSYGKPALVCAARKNHLEVVQMLLDAGIKLDIVERALSVAAYRGRLEIVQVLLTTRPDPNAVHATYDSALRGAAANGHLDILRLLLLSGADPNAPTSLRHSEDCTA